MSQNAEQEKGTLKSVSSFFKNPIAVFTASLLIALIVVVFEKRDVQIYGIIGVGFVYSLLSIVYAIWEEKVSSRRLREEKLVLTRKVEILENDNKKLKEKKDALEKEVPKVIAYSLVEKHVKIQGENGDAHFSMTYHGTNVSECPLRKVRHSITTREKLTIDRMSNIRFNNEDLYPDVKHIQFGKEWKNNIFLEASEPVPDSNPVVTHYEADLKKEYADGFQGGTTDSFHTVALKTDRLLFEITAPEGFFFINPDFDVRDVFSNIEIHKEKDRIARACPPIPKDDRKKIIWDIPNPRLSYMYILLFSLKKR